jgi:glutamine synthetase
MSPKEVLEFAKKNGAVMVDLKFVDFLGTWQHTSVPTHRLEESSFEDGFGFDGSSIRGFQPINASDMLIVPDATTAQMDPFMAQPTLSLICNIYDPISRQNYPRDPRYIAKKAEAYLKQTGIGDTCFCGPEAEFFVFDTVRYDATKGHESYYFIDSNEGHWNSGKEGAKGYKIRPTEGYFPVSPVDTLMDLRTEMCINMAKVGIEVETSHHEVATAGQCEINIRFDNLIDVADKMMWFKYIVKNVARRHGKTATFMPKPIFGDNGSGMHCHMSLWKGGEPLFAGDKYAGLSQNALYYIGGVLKHAPALCAITNPTTNSYKRLVPGFEAPTKLAYSYRNRSAAMRIPNTGPSPKAKRIEFRTPDPSANVYLAFAAMLMAGIDGIVNKTNPGDPLEKDIYGLPPEEAAKVASVPKTLDEALGNLQKDMGFLLKGDVFTKDFLETWLAYKNDREIIPMQQRPSPYEFYLYFDL